MANLVSPTNAANVLNGFKGIGQAMRDAQTQNDAELLAQVKLAQNAALVQAKLKAANSPYAGLPANMKEYAMLQQWPKDRQDAYMNFVKSKSPLYGGEFLLPDGQPVNQPTAPPAPTQPNVVTPPPVSNVIKQPAENIPPVTNQQINPFKFARQASEGQSLQPAQTIDTTQSVTPKPAENPIFPRNARGDFKVPKGAPSGYALAMVNGEEVLRPMPGSGKMIDSGKIQYQNTLRKEFNTQAKTFVNVQDAYSKIKKASTTGAGDMSMLYQYVKLLDPNSVVRESEFATAAQAGSYGQRIQNAVKRISEGGYLAPEMRKQFMDEAGNIYAGQKQGYDQLKANYSDIATRNGLEVKDVVTDYAAPPEVSPYKSGSIITAPDGRKGMVLPNGRIKVLK